MPSSSAAGYFQRGVFGGRGSEKESGDKKKEGSEVESFLPLVAIERNGKKKKKTRKTPLTVQVRRRRRDDPLRPHPDGDVVEQRLRELLPHGRHLRLRQIRPQKPHAAVDVEADASGRDDGLGV